ncbi:MAG: hypothetical protein HGA96_05465 [Desulfobulbaceae bacterium]|nr:hypothetical protein [Desulfobulbaceae bacterium]
MTKEKPEAGTAASGSFLGDDLVRGYGCEQKFRGKVFLGGWIMSILYSSLCPQK